MSKRSRSNDGISNINFYQQIVKTEPECFDYEERPSDEEIKCVYKSLLGRCSNKNCKSVYGTSCLKNDTACIHKHDKPDYKYNPNEVDYKFFAMKNDVFRKIISMFLQGPSLLRKEECQNDICEAIPSLEIEDKKRLEYLLNELSQYTILDFPLIPVRRLEIEGVNYLASLNGKKFCFNTMNDRINQATKILSEIISVCIKYNATRLEFVSYNNPIFRDIYFKHVNPLSFNEQNSRLINMQIERVIEAYESFYKKGKYFSNKTVLESDLRTYYNQMSGDIGDILYSNNFYVFTERLVSPQKLIGKENVYCCLMIPLLREYVDNKVSVGIITREGYKRKTTDTRELAFNDCMNASIFSVTRR